MYASNRKKKPLEKLKRIKIINYPMISYSHKLYLVLKVVSATFLLVCFVCLKDSSLERKKNVFYFTSKTLFILEIIKF